MEVCFLPSSCPKNSQVLLLKLCLHLACVIWSFLWLGLIFQLCVCLFAAIPVCQEDYSNALLSRKLKQWSSKLLRSSCIGEQVQIL